MNVLGYGGVLPLVVNVAAGKRGARVVRKIHVKARAAGVRVEVIAVSPGELGSAARTLRERGDEVVGVAGGDGTLATIATQLAGRASIVPIPTGTINHFTRRLGIPPLARGLSWLRAAQCVRLPLGIVDDRVFLNTFTLGGYARVVRRREQLRRWLTKWPAAAWATLEAVHRPRSAEIEIEWDGRRETRRTPLLHAATWWGREDPPPGGGPLAAPRLQVSVVEAVRPAQALAFLARAALPLMRGTMPGGEDPAVRRFTARSMLLHANGPLAATMDGETCVLDSPILVSVQADALSVLVPADR